MLRILGLFAAILIATTAITTVSGSGQARAASEHAVSSDLTAEERTAAENEMTTWKAMILGAVEGVTEYLPISSTGHLVVTQRILGIGENSATKDAADSYAIAI